MTINISHITLKLSCAIAIIIIYDIKTNIDSETGKRFVEQSTQTKDKKSAKLENKILRNSIILKIIQ